MRHPFMAAVVAAIAITGTVSGSTWNVTSDFSITNGNPNDAWTYGSMDTGFAALTPYLNHAMFANGPAWYGWNSDYTPVIWKNTTNQVIGGVSPGQVSLHPGPGTEPSVARWTAPATVSGSASIAGQFFPGDAGAMDVAVRLNGIEIWHNVNFGQFDLNVNVQPGDIIDFAVYGGYGWGNTPLDAQIVAVPEPTVILMLGVGILALIRRQS